MTEFLVLRPKLCAYKTLHGSGNKKYKGVMKCQIKKMLDFDDYKLCLFEGKNAFWNQLFFQDKKRKVHIMEVNKLAVSRNDDKKVVQSDGTWT